MRALRPGRRRRPAPPADAAPAAPPAAGRRRPRSRPRPPAPARRRAAVAAQDQRARRQPGRGQRAGQPRPAGLGGSSRPEQRPVVAARVGRRRAHHQRLRLRRALRPRRPERQPGDDVDARRRPRAAAPVHQAAAAARPPPAAAAPRRSPRRALHVARSPAPGVRRTLQRRQRAEMLARHREQPGRLASQTAISSGRCCAVVPADQLAPDPHQAGRRQARRGGGPAAGGRSPPRGPGRSGTVPLAPQRADLRHHLGPAHQQVVQRVVEPVELRAQRGQRWAPADGGIGRVHGRLQGRDMAGRSLMPGRAGGE